MPASPQLSANEASALSILQDYGLESALAAACIGRSRRELAPGSTVDQIVDCSLNQLQLDAQEWDTLERRIWDQTRPLHTEPEGMSSFQIALDQERFLAQAAFNKTIKALEQKLLGAEEVQPELEFWQKIIASEVDRLRLNQGLEPIEIDLYPAPGADKRKLQYLGETRIGHTRFRGTAYKALDSQGRQIVHLSLKPQGS